MRLFSSVEGYGLRASFIVGASLRSSGIAVIAFALNIPLHADPIVFGPNRAIASIAESFGSPSSCSVDEVSAASCSVSGALAFANVTDGTGGEARASLVVGPPRYATATSFYSIFVAGPANASVPLIISGNTETHDDGSTEASTAALFVGTGNTPEISDVFGSIYSCIEALSHNPRLGCVLTGPFSLNATFPSNTFIGVILNASVQGIIGGGVAGSASIDSVKFAVDPSFPQASLFTVLAPPGVFDSGTPPPSGVVPEPGMSGLCLLGISWMIWRKSKKRKKMKSTN
jgi:hypothetical protein